MLTESWLKANHNKTHAKLFERADRDALSVRVSAKGKIVFQYRYRYDGKPCRLDLGVYPNLSLKDARQKLMTAKALLDEGKNPKIEFALEKAQHKAEHTFSELFDVWYDSVCVKSKKSALQIKASVQLHLIPKLGDLPLGRISIGQWLDVLEPISERTPAIAERLLVNIKQLLKWAKKRRIINENCLSDIYAKSDLGVKKRRAKRVLADDEISLLFMALDNSRTTYKNRLFVELCLMWGCRNGELRTALKSDFDFDKKIWVLPWQKHKTGKVTERDIVRPILPQMEVLLIELMSLQDTPYLILKDKSNDPMSDKAPLSIPYNLMQWVRKNTGIEMAHWSMHDLRRTARTNFSAITSRDVAELMIGHEIKGEQASYDYYDYLDEQTKAYKKWLDKLDGLRQANKKRFR